MCKQVLQKPNITQDLKMAHIRPINIRINVRYRIYHVAFLERENRTLYLC